ncbi:hypothetical protein TNCV_4989351 [Trichonephila clavipes]|uniref:Uncharacterized protein n=1 Tax=Trichonephila clavipes TaxID=2585209 RepID=A0A8X6WC40_TRICX|nr:hypothetical protein TNCV_4989351 [Trichonephila clavipes]
MFLVLGKSSLHSKIRNIEVRNMESGTHRVQCIGAGGCHHSRMAAEWADLVSSQAKLVEVYSQKVMSGGFTKEDNSLDSLKMPRGCAHSGQFPMAFQSF